MLLDYATQVNRHSINNLIDAVHTASQDIDNLYNVTTSLASSISFNQMILHIRSVFANLHDSIHYLHTLSTHTKDYINATTSGMLSPHVLPVADLWKMPTAHCRQPTSYSAPANITSGHPTLLQVSVHTHVLIENKQFLLLIDIPIQDRAHQITIHQVFTLDIPHGNYSARYDINTQYFGVTKDATMGLELSHTQFEACRQANGLLPHLYAFSTFGKSTNMHCCSICQECSQHRIKMLSTATQGYSHPSPDTDHTRCLDTHNSYFSTYRHHKFDMPREAFGNHPNQTTTTCTQFTNGLQCHFSKLLPATKV